MMKEEVRVVVGGLQLSGIYKLNSGGCGTLAMLHKTGGMVEGSGCVGDRCDLCKLQ